MTLPARVILHLDLDAFFAAVEVLENPGLAGKPVVVGGGPQGRGVVASASYPARAFGIRSAMPTARALALCPQAVVVPPRHGVYREYSRQVMSILHQTTPQVEQMSVDEAFLDLTAQLAEWEEGVAIARQLQLRVRDETGLSASLGVATNKLVAKVASERDKPGGLTVVRPGEEASFLSPLSVRALWGVGPVTAQRLAAMGVHTVAELAQVPEERLRAQFGRSGTAMARQALGIDEHPVVTEHEIHSVSRERTFGHDLTDPGQLKQELCSLSQSVARRLKRRELAAGTIAVKLRYSDFATFGRQMSLAVPTDDEQEIYCAALRLFAEVWQKNQPVRLLGVAGRHLTRPVGQLRLPLDAGTR